ISLIRVFIRASSIMIEMIEQDGYLSTLKEMSPTSGGISAKTYLAEVLWPDGEVISIIILLALINIFILHFNSN
ncbi:hypothetical protein ACT4UT_33185, partial [Bacillus sp. B-TM1]